MNRPQPIIFTEEELPRVCTLLKELGVDCDNQSEWQARAGAPAKLYVQHLCIPANGRPRLIGANFEDSRYAVNILEKVWIQILKERAAAKEAEERRGGWSLANNIFTHGPTGLSVHLSAFAKIPEMIEWLSAPEAKRFGMALVAQGFVRKSVGGYYKREGYAPIYWGSIGLGTPEEVRKSLEVYDSLDWTCPPIVGIVVHELASPPDMVAALEKLYRSCANRHQMRPESETRKEVEEHIWRHWIAKCSEFK